jgi:DNA-directed RNA polymerase specialized sigma24 family protein
MRLGGIHRDMSLLLSRRQERSFERIYRRHVADVYRYALVVLRDPQDAESVTRATFATAYRKLEQGERLDEPSNWLLRTAHEVCRWRSLHEDHHRVEEFLEDERSRDSSLACHAAERAISRQLDGKLPHGERKQLREHLRSCPECSDFAKTQDSQRAALRSLERVPLPDALHARTRKVPIVPALRVTAAAATAVVVGGVLAGGVDPRQWGHDATEIQPADAAPPAAKKDVAPRVERLARKKRAARTGQGS